jgi:hypothetical protein
MGSRDSEPAPESLADHPGETWGEVYKRWAQERDQRSRENGWAIVEAHGQHLAQPVTTTSCAECGGDLTTDDGDNWEHSDPGVEPTCAECGDRLAEAEVGRGACVSCAKERPTAEAAL